MKKNLFSILNKITSDKTCGETYKVLKPNQVMYCQEQNHHETYMPEQKLSHKKEGKEDNKRESELEELQEKLKQAIKKEEYEEAAKIRDEIKKISPNIPKQTRNRWGKWGKGGIT